MATTRLTENNLKEKNHKPLMAIVLLVSLVGASFVLLPSVVFATRCTGNGTVITSDTSLTVGITNCHGDGIIIGASGVVFNCNGHDITGAAGNTAVGIYLHDVNQVTIVNCNVYRFGNDIVLNDSSDDYIVNDNGVSSLGSGFFLTAHSDLNTITGSSATSNEGSGYYINGSSGNIINGNTAVGNQVDGFLLAYATANSFEGNVAARSGQSGFALTLSSTDNTLIGNTARNGPKDGFSVDSTSTGNTLIGNLANANGQFGYIDSSTSGTAAYPYYGTANSYIADGYNHDFTASSPSCGTPSATCKLTQPGFF